MNLPAIRQLAISIGDDQVSQFTNAGLVLDRFAAYRNEACKEFDQKDQNQHIQRVIKANKKNLQANFGILGAWRSLFDALPSPKREWTQATVWRLAAHLARATSLENGSACLHPIYGFPFLPGSGLKGLARSWAQRCGAEQVAVQRIFGSVDVPRGNGESVVEWSDAAGSVGFLEAWPAQWPTLKCDIVNVHHRAYYTNKGVASPPGDWESPVPTYFLAVAPDSVFRFAVVGRDCTAPQVEDDVAKAAEWLQKALQNLGAGAKTSVGYGYFGEPRPSQ